MFISISLEFYFKLYSNTAHHKLWTSIAGTLQTQLVPVVFICAYRFVFNYWYTFVFLPPMFNFQPQILGRFFNNLNLQVIMTFCSKYYIDSWISLMLGSKSKQINSIFFWLFSFFCIGKRKRNEILHQHCFICKKKLTAGLQGRSWSWLPKVCRVV